MKVKVLSAGVIPVRWDQGRWLYLMLRAYQYWDFPKGRTEAGETPLEAARREVREETGLESLDFRWGYGFIETGPYGRGKLARYYIAQTEERNVVMGISPELGRPEHHEFRWLDYDTAYSLSAPRVRRVLQWSRRQLAHDEAPQSA